MGDLVFVVTGRGEGAVRASLADLVDPSAEVEVRSDRLGALVTVQGLASPALAPHLLAATGGVLAAPPIGRRVRIEAPVPEAVPRGPAQGDPVPDSPRTLQVAAIQVSPTLRFGDGAELVVDRPLVLGRDPDLPPGSPPGTVLVEIEDQQLLLSKTHLAVTPQGDTVVVEDLGSTNGTEVAVRGGPFTRIPARQPIPIEPGDAVRFGPFTATVERS